MCCALDAMGTRLVSGSDDNTLKLWDTHSGREIHSFAGHSGNVRCCALDATGTRLVSGSSDQTIKLWDTQSGREIHSWDLPCPAHSVSLMPASGNLWPERAHSVATQVLAVGLSNGVVLLLDLTEYIPGSIV
jgi:WD40 repeat protein